MACAQKRGIQMKRVMFLVAGLAGLCLTNMAAAQNPVIPPQGPFGVPLMGGAPQTVAAQCSADMYGWCPALKRIFHLPRHRGNACSPAEACGPVAGPSMYPQGGTLAFPNHPFARSPRDFFMVEK
jgi:hypothetical protein